MVTFAKPQGPATPVVEEVVTAEGTPSPAAANADSALATEARSEFQDSATSMEEAFAATPAQSLEEQVALILLDGYLSGADKVSQLQSLQSYNDLSDQELRKLIGSAYVEPDGEINPAMLLVIGRATTLERVQELQAEQELLDEAFGNAFFGLWENNRIQRVLEVRASTIEAEPKPNVDAELQEILFDPRVSTDRKIELLQQLQEALCLSDKEMREKLGVAFSSERAQQTVAEIQTPEQARAMRTEQDALDDAFGNGVFGLWENNKYEASLRDRQKELTAAREAQAEFDSTIEAILELDSLGGDSLKRVQEVAELYEDAIDSRSFSEDQKAEIKLAWMQKARAYVENIARGYTDKDDLTKDMRRLARKLDLDRDTVLNWATGPGGTMER